MSNSHGEWLDRIKGRENRMAKYHVGCGLVGIYAGTLKQNGEIMEKQVGRYPRILVCSSAISFIWRYGISL